MKQEIRVTVKGVHGSGKSTILYLMKQVLKANGLDVEFGGGIDFQDELGFDLNTGSHLQEKILALKGKSKIIMDEVQLSRTMIKYDEKIETKE